MARYHFHFRGTASIPDNEGEEFSSLAEAKEEAVRAARDEIRKMVDIGVIDLSSAFEVEGPNGEHATVLFSEVVRIIGTVMH